MNDYYEVRSIEEGIKELNSKIVNEAKNSIERIKFKKRNFLQIYSKKYILMQNDKLFLL